MRAGSTPADATTFRSPFDGPAFKAPTGVDENRVGSLLADSHAHHKRAVALGLHKLNRGGNTAAVKDAIVAARDARLEAHRDDPEHTAPAWKDEIARLGSKDAHRELLRFYTILIERKLA